MDQLKEGLRLAIKYRFWIAVGLSALFPLIAYFLGAGPVQAKAAAEAAKIKGADEGVKKYTSPSVPTADYKRLVDEKTEALTEDVNHSWKKLYARQAPLLTWPDRVQDKFTKWGRKWPEGVDSSTVQFAINDYVNVYPEFVTKIYKSFSPFNPEDGEGVVSAPPEAALLRPAQFTSVDPPTLGKVWASQERLWVQRTMLDVVAQVNKDAKDWDGAIIKQIEALEVGSPAAQDQRSIAKGEELEEAPDINDPSKPVEEAAAATGEAGGYADMMAGMMGGGKSMGGMMPGMSGGMGGGGAPPASVFYIKNDSTQYKVLPVMMTVLVEQDRIQDFLIALENSPMNVQVMDFEMAKPDQRVTKPEKGVGMMMGMGMMGMGGMEMMGMTGYGGMMRGRGGMDMMGMGGMSGMMPGMDAMGGYGMGMGMGMGGMGGTVKKGLDKRGENRAKEAQKQLEAAKKLKGSSLHDPYFNIVQVTVYGQARFFNPPPEEQPAAPSMAEGEASATEAPDADAPKAEAPAADAPKADSP